MSCLPANSRVVVLSQIGAVTVYIKGVEGLELPLKSSVKGGLLKFDSIVNVIRVVCEILRHTTLYLAAGVVVDLVGAGVF